MPTWVFVLIVIVLGGITAGALLGGLDGWPLALCAGIVGAGTATAAIIWEHTRE